MNILIDIGGDCGECGDNILVGISGNMKWVNRVIEYVFAANYFDFHTALIALLFEILMSSYNYIL